MTKKANPNNPRCPHCSSPSTKSGYRDGEQRYACLKYMCKKKYFYASEVKQKTKYRGIPAGKIVYPGYVYGGTRLS